MRHLLPVAVVLALLVVGGNTAAQSRELAAARKASTDIRLSNARNYIGLQVGGSGYFQVAGRIHVAGPLKLELGALGWFVAGGFGNASIGLSIELPLTTFSPYASAGVGGGIGCGEDATEPDEETGESSIYLSCAGAAFQYSRIGVAIDFYADRTARLLIDGGAWYGMFESDTGRRRTFFGPMVGVGLYISL